MRSDHLPFWMALDSNPNPLRRTGEEKSTSYQPLAELVVPRCSVWNPQVINLQSISNGATEKSLPLRIHTCVLVAQSCPTLCNPIDCSPPGPSVHGILQARTLEWVAVSFSKRNYRKKEKSLSHVRLFVTPWTVCSLPGSSICGIFQPRVLEWVAISFSTWERFKPTIYSLWKSKDFCTIQVNTLTLVLRCLFLWIK